MLDIRADHPLLLALVVRIASPKTRPKFAGSYAELLELQRALMTHARKKRVKAVVLTYIARAYCELEERKRILRMRPKPKDVDVLELAKLKAAQRRERAALVTELEPGDEPAETKPGYRMQPAHPTPSDSPTPDR